MGENTQEKNLIEKKESGFFGKIKSFFRNLFCIKNNENTVIEKENNNVKENNDFKEYIKTTEDEDTKLLELQRKYRNGEIGENDLTDEQIDDLCDLYDKQIAELKKAIEIKEQKITNHKLKKQHRIENNNA